MSEGIVIRKEQVLLCPECSFNYVHPVRVKVATGDRVTLIDSKGTRTIQEETAETREAAKERGVRISIECCCEDGDHGNIIFQFHKGQTFVYHEVLRSLSREEWETLWRD